MKLSRLLAPLDITEGYQEVEITDIVYDSRKAKQGCVFVCMRGSNSDGHKYAAGAAQAAFEVIRDTLAQKDGGTVSRGTVVLATVKGDIHDIGKNIVKTVLENYGYQVIDLGRDVPPQAICDAVAEGRIPLVGLSALMTTTLPAMEETIRMLKALPEPPAVFVGGAVVTPEYAQRMGADYYAKDARQSVEIAREVLGA